MPSVCRVLPHQVASGAEQMAIDHALLDSVDTKPDQAVLRTYEWSAPTLSLGYFQHVAGARSDSRWQSLSWVRRPSGGGALLHDRELTYALVVPRTHSLARRPTSLYRAMHAAITHELAQLGIPATLRGESSLEETNRPFLCFLDQDPNDVVLHGVKIVGSAQRRRPAAVLQHGSLLLAQSAYAPELLGLYDLGIKIHSLEQWTMLIQSAASRALEIRMVEGSISEAESEAARLLERSTYRNQLWLERR